MPVKKRRVTFDPEVKPSSASSPPPLVLANYPPIITKKDIEDIQFQFESKSILKNPPEDDKPYESLCNFLIDLPPPPSSNVLSLDVLQQETVFKPDLNRFARLRAEEKNSPVFEFEMSDENSSSDDDDDHVHLDSDSFSADEFDLTPEITDEINEVLTQITHKPNLFESAIMLEQNVDEKSFYNKKEEEIFTTTYELKSSTEEYVVNESTEETYELNDDYSFLEEKFDENVISTIEDQIISSSLNIYDEVILKEPELIQIVPEHRDITQNPLASDDITTTLNENDSANTLIPNESLISDKPALTTETLRPQSESNLLDSLPTQFISSSPTNNSSSEMKNETITELGSEELGNTNDGDIENRAEQVVQLDNNTYEIDKGRLYSQNTLTPFHDITSKGNIIPFNSHPLDPTSSDPKPDNNQTESRQRRRSGKKTHRKHSKSRRSSSKEDLVSTKTSVINVVALQEQKAAEAQARFKRYLAKMSGKAMAETQNLNYAGEPETLEPHMRDSIKESQILIWIYNMIDEAARVDFEFFLKDGCILCKLMNRIVPGCIPEDQITWEGARSKQKNISNFLREAEKYGVPKAKLFFPEDLLHLRHVPRVTRCIYALAKIAQGDPSLGEETPQLGDEPSFLKETTTKVVVPGHRDTKDVLAQLTASKGDDDKKKLAKHSLYK